jgi:hypothetical protein
MEDKIRVLKVLADKQQTVILDLQTKNEMLTKKAKVLEQSNRASMEEISRLCEEAARNAENLAVLRLKAGDTGNGLSNEVASAKHVVVDARQRPIRHGGSSVCDQRKRSRYDGTASVHTNFEEMVRTRSRAGQPELYASSETAIARKGECRTNFAPNTDLIFPLQRPEAIVRLKGRDFDVQKHPSRSAAQLSSNDMEQETWDDDAICSPHQPSDLPGSGAINQNPHSKHTMEIQRNLAIVNCNKPGAPTATVHKLFETSRTAARVAWRMFR